MKLRPFCLTALVALAACGQMDENRDIRAPAATVAGEPVNCLETNRIRNTKVWDDYTIDFETTGGTTYRNTLPNQCPQLGFEERFGYTTSISRLCSTDIIHVLYSDGQSGAACGLGKFVPVKVAAN